MADTAEIIKLDDRRQTRGTVDLRHIRSVISKSVVSGDDEPAGSETELPNTDVGNQQKRSTSIDDLYDSDTPTGALIHNARRILSEIEARAAEAQRLHNARDFIGADNEIALLQADLPELFCCSTLSDGFAAVVIAIFHGLRNRGFDALNIDQLFVVRRATEKLRSDPFLDFNLALDLIDALADSGLKTDPVESEHLGELLADPQEDKSEKNIAL
jgi:hypothetical protein